MELTFHRTFDGVNILLIHLFICAYLLFSVKVTVDVCQSVGLMYHVTHQSDNVISSCGIILIIILCFFFKAQKDRILIKGGIVVNDDDMIEADVFIESGVIK